MGLAVFLVFGLLIGYGFGWFVCNRDWMSRKFIIGGHRNDYVVHKFVTERWADGAGIYERVELREKNSKDL